MRIVATLAAAAVWALAMITVSGAPQAPADARLLDPGALVYAGAFRLPRGTFGVHNIQGQNVATFAYGGTALAFNPARNSLFIVGHDWGQLVAEISIPAVRSASPEQLDTARVLQPFTDVTEGAMSTVGPNTVKIGGLLAYANRLLVTAYLYFDGAGSQRLSHFVSGADLSIAGDVEGPYQVGSLGAGFVSGYLAEVPPEWRDQFGLPVLTGNCCLAVISRTSSGPALFAMDPGRLAGVPAAPATPLVYYPSMHPLAAWDATNPLFNGTTEITGVVFPRGTRSVLFFGRRGLGPFCYGPGTANPGQAGQPAEAGVDRFCYDPAIASKGPHAYPYEYAVWAYDARDLLAVKNRARAPWDVKPYGAWKLDVPGAPPHARLLGAAYDPATGRVFLAQAYADGDNPVIRVFEIS